MFEKFPSLTRFSHGWTITEKLDGTNAAVLVVHAANPDVHDYLNQYPDTNVASVDEWFVFAQSRTRLITPQQDNHGFARFVQDNAEELVAKLGEGRHFGEWVGPGIGKRHYNLKEKQFALFNVKRWKGIELPDRVTHVPVIANYEYFDNPGNVASIAMRDLLTLGSKFGPKIESKGFANPEGVVMYHAPSNTAFKKTFDYDEQGKWAEKSG